MTSEWDGTPWAGTATSDLTAKAATGVGVAMVEYGSPYRITAEKVPQRMMKAAQMAYHVNPWIRLAESTVTRRVAGLPWHLEDENDAEIPDTVRTGIPGIVRSLLEKPQANLSQQQPGCSTWRGLASLTSRHLGLCGMAFWYQEQKEAMTGLPLGFLYINPARMWPAEDDAGNLHGWVLDPDAFDARGRPIGGTPLRLDEVIPFYLDPPDYGNIGSGLYEAALLKAHITTMADQHASYVLGTGGRLAGIVAPKTGSLDPKQFADLEREFRNVNEAPDAAKRTTILSGPVDWTPTAANPHELNLEALGKMNRDDILAVWGVPPATAGIPSPAGLNSGDTRKYDEAILMQGAVHDRVRAMVETIQGSLLDPLTAVIELEVEEPEFDDRLPLYEMAAKARELPLTNRERRELIGLPPFAEEGKPADPRDDEVWLPVNLTVAYEASGEKPEPPEPAGPFPPLPPDGPPAVPAPGQEDGDGQSSPGPGKAGPVKAAPTRFARSMQTSLTRLRAQVEKSAIPAMSSAVDDVLEEQKREIIARVRANAAHIVANPGDDDAWWNGPKWDRRMRAALAPEQARVAEATASHIGDVLAP
jgi:phage portal protein BeeE